MNIPQITIEGGDLTGKTTLRRAIFRMDNSPGKKLFIGDRGILTHLLYNQYFNRYEELNDCFGKDLLDYLTNNGLLILRLSDENVTKRFKDRGDHLYSIEPILGMNRLYNVFSEGLENIPFVKVIEADDKTVVQTIAEAKPWLEMMMSADMTSKIWNLYRMIQSISKTVGMTREITNIRLQAIENNLETAKFESMLDYFGGFTKTVSHGEYTMAIDNHTSFFTALKNKMIYIIQKEIKMYGQREDTSRRFHFTNDAGGCISTLGINFRQNTRSGLECLVTANFRSSDIVILPFDIFGVYSVVSDIIKPKIAKNIFKPGFTSKIEKFYLTINIESAHINFEDKLREYDHNINN
jgi:thymidylate kinase